MHLLLYLPLFVSYLPRCRSRRRCAVAPRAAVASGEAASGEAASGEAASGEAGEARGS